MREFTGRNQSGDLAEQLIGDHGLFHLEADLRWWDLAAERPAGLGAQVKRSTSL